MSSTSSRLSGIDAEPRTALAVVRPLELAQLVWRRALELVDPIEHHDRFALALDLLRTAQHDPATVSHALVLGRTHLRANADDAIARSGARILESAIAFLGVKPATGRHRPAPPMTRERQPKHGDGTAWLVVDRASGDYLCYWYAGTNDGHPVERARMATASEAVAWGRLRSPSVRIRTADSRTYWAGTAPRPGGFEHTWTDPAPAAS